MRPLFVVVDTPLLDDSACLFERCEPMQVQAFFTQAAVEAFDIRVLRRLSGIDEVKLDTVIRRPSIERAPTNSGP